MANIKISIRAARVNACLTQKEAAKALHRTKSKIGAWEAGRDPISYADLLAMLELYNIPFDNIRLYDSED